jgi:CheY-like chemotaxis protein
MTRQRHRRTRPQRAGDSGAKVKIGAGPVLVVDDEPFVRQIVAEIVTDTGFEVVEACDGAVAIGLLREGLRPSLILIDLSMPTMDGSTFRRTQVKDPALRGIPTVMLTGSRVDPEALGRELGDIKIMAKPVDYGELLALLKRHCAQAA